VREHKYAGCSINLEIGPIEWPDMMTMRAIWNTTQKNKAIYILGAGLTFDRSLEPPAPSPEPPKKSGWFSG
jgi:hypothetical protein